MKEQGEDMKDWTPEFALRYMTSHSDEFYMEKLQHRFDKFDVKNVCKKHFKAFKNIQSVCDIGAGVMGGALTLFPYGHTRMVVDFLAEEYEKIGKVSKEISFYHSDFGDIGLISEFADVVFSWECLDHARTKEHFDQGQEELARILSGNGLLFFYLPLRDKPKPAHVIIRTRDQIIKKFEDLGLKLIHEEIELNWNRYEKAMYAIFKKDPLD